MLTKLAKPSSRVPTGLYGTLFAVLISLLAAGGVLGGFLLGRNSTRDAFIERVGAARGSDGVTLISAGSAPLSLLEVLGERIDDELTAHALAKIYGVAADDRDQLIQRLDKVVWLPPFRPAPFVGHAARPFFSDDLRINVLGFRDERQSYLDKPSGTVRVFITGGSTAWGSGASSQRNTISYSLEKLLNEQVGRTTGYRYEVINTAFPAWSTTQEKLLIQQRLVDLHPDVVLMVSGNNDIHWSVAGRDIRWHYTYTDENYIRLLNEAYAASGHPERTIAVPASSQKIECPDLGRMTARNVDEAAFAAGQANARLIFILQPNIVSTAKHLTRYEQRVRQPHDQLYWNACYQALRDELQPLGGQNYRFVDLSRSFGGIGDDSELFIDAYHFGDVGNGLVAQAIIEQIDWRSIVPGQTEARSAEPLSIVKFEQAAAGETIRIIPNRINRNLLIVLDRSELPTVVGDDALTARRPASNKMATGGHTIRIVDGVTGEASQPVILEKR